MKIKKRKYDATQVEARVAAALARLRNKVGTVIARVPSNTKPGVIYDIKLGTGNTVYCQCNGFKYRQDCDHMKRFRNECVAQVLKRRQK